MPDDRLDRPITEPADLEHLKIPHVIIMGQMVLPHFLGCF